MSQTRFPFLLPPKKRLLFREAIDEKGRSNKKRKIQEENSLKNHQDTKDDQETLDDHGVNNINCLPFNLLPIKKRPLRSPQLMNQETLDDQERSKKKRKIQEENSLKNHQDTKDDQETLDDHGVNNINSLPFNLLPIKKRPLRSPQLMNLIHTSLPWKLKEKIDDMGGYDIKIIIQKKLFKSDLSSNHNRFSIPENNIPMEAIDFLRKEEIELMQTRSTNCMLAGLPVLLLDPSLRKFELILKKWSMRTSSIYNLTHKWNSVVQSNDLKLNDMVQLWSFRNYNNQLCFALIRLEDEDAT